MRIYIVLLFSIILSISLSAQTDSAAVISFKDFSELVKKYHPLAAQARLMPEIGQATILSARGNFDPKLFTNLDQKYFDDKKYFSLLDAGLKVPTWYGIELKTGYEQNQGVFLDPENNNPSQGLAYAGISIPLGQGLFIDQRRATLKQAKIFANASIAEQQLMLNELFFNAGKSYWDWFYAYNNQLIYENALQIAQQRFDAVKQSARLGDRPFVDTLEAGIQLQERKISLQQAELDFKNKSLQLSTFLWFENNIPLELSSTATPVAAGEISITENEILKFILKLDSLEQTHPALKISQFKISDLEVEKRWKSEKLKPVLNVNYNALSVPVNSDFISNYSINNYKWGLSFMMPILLRKERGDLKLTKLKLAEAEFDLKSKNLELLNKAKASLNEHTTSRQQINLYTQTVKDYQGLLSAEKRMFDSGESSLFLINARELSTINARVKLIDFITKNRKALLSVEYSFGELGL